MGIEPGFPAAQIGEPVALERDRDGFRLVTREERAARELGEARNRR